MEKQIACQESRLEEKPSFYGLPHGRQNRRFGPRKNTPIKMHAILFIALPPFLARSG